MPRYRDQVAFTPEGLKQLAQLCLKARNGEAYARWQLTVGLSGVTLNDIEREKLKALSINTLVKLSAVLGYSVEELLRICAGEDLAVIESERIEGKNVDIREATTFLMLLPLEERVKLLRLVIDKSKLSPRDCRELIQALAAKII